MDTVAIVGASLAGAKAAEGLRDNGYSGRLVLIGEETERPYERPPLSKGYLLGQQPREKAYVHEASWYPDHDVELLLGVRATNLDAGAHTLTLDGYEPLRYDKLLLATGWRARRGQRNRGRRRAAHQPRGHLRVRRRGEHRPSDAGPPDPGRALVQRAERRQGGRRRPRR